MNIQQKQAILDYLEFHLITFVEQTEKNVYDTEVIGDMYQRAYGILNDFDEVITTQIELTSTTPLTKDR